MTSIQTSSINVPLAQRTAEAIRADLAKAEIDEYAIEQLIALHTVACTRDLGLKALAHKCGVSNGVLSQMYNGTYTGNYLLRARKIEQFLVDEEKAQIFGGRDDFVETSFSRSLWAIFERARYSRRIQFVQSEEQLGKSRSATEYTRRHNGGRTIMVTLKPGGSSNPFGVFLRDLALASGIHDIRFRKILDLRYDVEDSLAICDLVIIDEFHQIEHWTDRAVKDLLDYIRVVLQADGKRGVVLIATNSDVRTLLDSFRKRTNYNMGQLLGRSCNQDVELFSDEIPLDDVRALVERYYSPGKRLLAKLYDIACRPKLGHFGLLLDILNRAWTDCKIERQDLTDAVVEAIARDTMEDIDKRKAMYA
jgi:hypothetical protein